MKVLQILTHLNMGGITTYVYTLSKYLLRKNIEVAIASSGGNWEKNFRELGVKVFRINIRTKSELSPKLATSLYQLYKIKKEFDFKIIHSHTRVTQVVSQIFSIFMDTHHIANFHGFYHKNKLRWGRKILKAQGKISIAITPYVKDDLIKVFGADTNGVRVIISGIDLERLRENTPSLMLEGSPRIGSSGRLSSVKGFEYLVRSLPLVLKKYPDAYLYILGEGEEKQNLLNLARELGVEARFRILKDINLSSFLKAIDLFCLPSLQEPLGLSVIEAQFFGIPCVVSDVGGLKILVNHLKTGIRVPSKNTKEISKAINIILEDTQLSRTISNNCAKQVEEEFDFAKKVDEFINIYKEVLSKPR